MQQAIDEDGYIWNVDAQGNPVGDRPVGRANPQQAAPAPAAPRPFTVGTPRAPEQKAPYRWQANDGSLMEVGPDGNPRVVYRDTPAPKAGAGDGAKQDQRIANLRALQQNIARVRELYQQNLKGGWPNQATALVPDFLNPALGQFDSAGAGLSETGLAAFRVPGVGSQSDAELRAFVDANRPSSTDSDLKIEEKLRNLETRLNATMQEIGVPQTTDPMQGATVLPQAAGVQAAAPMQVSGVTSKGGLIEIPQLRGIENQVADMIGRGASTDQIVGFLRQQYQPYGADVGPELQGYLGDIVRKHQANPRQPVKSLGTGWENLYYRKAPDTAQANTFMGIDPDSGLGTGVMTAANAATGGLPAYLAGKQDVMNAAAQERPGAALAGEVAGGVAAMTGINGAAGALGKAGSLLTRGGGIGGDMLYGATRGGLENGPTGAITGALAAGVGNKVGGSVVNTAGRVARGVSDPAVNYLSERGVPLTLGQLLGNRGMTGKLLNRLESAPVLGDMMAARRTDSIEGFNREALRQAIEPVGANITATGREGLDQAYGAVDQGYDSALAGQRFSGNEPQFIQEMGAAIQRGQAVPKLGEDFSYIMQNDVAPMFDSSGVLTGDRLQAALQGIRKARSGFAGQPMGQYAGNALTDAENAITGMVGRQAPDVMPRLSAANKAYGNVSTIGDAVNTAVNQGGLFTPAQLGRAAVNNTKKFGGKRAAATGDVPFRALQEAGQQVLPSTVPDSGTAGRAASLLLPGVLGGSAVGADQLGASPSVTVPLAVLAALSSKTGAKVAQKALTGRSPTAVKAGNALIRNRRKGGLFGAALTTGSVMPQLSQ